MSKRNGSAFADRMTHAEFIEATSMVDQFAAMARKANDFAEPHGQYIARGVGGHGGYGACQQAGLSILADLFGEITGHEVWYSMLENDFSAMFAILHNAWNDMENDFEDRKYLADADA